MKSQCLFGFALAAVAALGAPLMAQVVSVPPTGTVLPAIFIEQSFTTGMVGFTLNQTARLNVLNLNAVPAADATAPAATCTVQLQFFDGKNNLLGQSVIPNFAPGMATAFDLKRQAVTAQTTSRAEIRGVVTVNPTPMTVASLNPVGYCSVMTTLEIMDDNTGSTVALTSDVRATGLGYAVPAIVQALR
jgi:hypothetical protein